MYTLRYSIRNYKDGKQFKTLREVYDYLYPRGYSLIQDGNMYYTRFRKYSYKLRKFIECYVHIK